MSLEQNTNRYKSDYNALALHVLVQECIKDKSLWWLYQLNIMDLYLKEMFIHNESFEYCSECNQLPALVKCGAHGRFFHPSGGAWHWPIGLLAILSICRPEIYSSCTTQIMFERKLRTLFANCHVRYVQDLGSGGYNTHATSCYTLCMFAGRETERNRFARGCLCRYTILSCAIYGSSTFMYMHISHIVYIYIFIHHRIYFIWRSNGIILLAVQMFSKSL